MHATTDWAKVEEVVDATRVYAEEDDILAEARRERENMRWGSVKRGLCRFATASVKCYGR